MGNHFNYEAELGYGYIYYFDNSNSIKINEGEFTANLLLRLEVYILERIERPVAVLFYAMLQLMNKISSSRPIVMYEYTGLSTVLQQLPNTVCVVPLFQ
ncbi:hypothetical protein BH10BAC2_BH10BAC2_49010 [soil metagenome]